MAFSNKVWTTDTAASLDAASYSAVSDVTTNGTAYVVDNLTLLGTNNAALRVDSGSLTIAENEIIVAAVDQNDADTAENAIHVNGGTLIIEGSADEDSPHTFLNINGDYAALTSGSTYRSGQAGIVLTNGNIEMGSTDKPYCRYIGHKNFTIDVSDDSFIGTGESFGAAAWTIETLILQNPQRDDITADGQLPNLGFRTTSSNYTADGSSFDTVVLDGFNILDVSGASSFESGMFPANVVFKHGLLVGDNGTLARGNNLVGVAYIAIQGNGTSYEYLLNTTGVGVDTLADSNWFVNGNTDGPVRAHRRFDNQRGGFLSNRLITVTGNSEQKFYIPETNDRLTNSAVLDVDDISGQTNLGGANFNPVISDTVTAGDVPLGGSDGRYSVVKEDCGTEVRIRASVGWSAGGSGITSDTEIVEYHDADGIIYYGSRDRVVGHTLTNLYATAGVQNLSVAAVDTVDANISIIDSTTRNAAANANVVVTLPTVTEVSDGTLALTIELGESSATTFTISELVVAVKDEMVDRLDDAPHPSNFGTDEDGDDWTYDHTDDLSNWTISNSGGGLVTIAPDDAYTSTADLTVTGDNIRIQPNVITFNVDVEADVTILLDDGTYVTELATESFTSNSVDVPVGTHYAMASAEGSQGIIQEFTVVEFEDLTVNLTTLNLSLVGYPADTANTGRGTQTFDLVTFDSRDTLRMKQVGGNFTYSPSQGLRLFGDMCGVVVSDENLYNKVSLSNLSEIDTEVTATNLNNRNIYELNSDGVVRLNFPVIRMKVETPDGPYAQYIDLSTAEAIDSDYELYEGYTGENTVGGSTDDTPPTGIQASSLAATADTIVNKVNANTDGEIDDVKTTVNNARDFITDNDDDNFDAANGG